MFSSDGTVYPVEIKSGGNLHSKSLTTALKANPALKGLRFSLSPYKEQDDLINIPLYLAEEFIKTIP